jgi:oligopeptide/dipeptide ABC transporter ATP-binding protein
MSAAPVNGRAVTPLLDVHGLVVEFRVGRRVPPLRAVDGVDLRIAQRETVGLVGESGSGKSTLGRAILGLTSVKEGTIDFDGADITSIRQRDRRKLSAKLQVVFQDPYSSLNVTRTIGQTLGETLRVHQKLSAAELGERVAMMLEKVGLPADAAGRYPAQFSGGQRQRIAIARALMVSPHLVICDEAVSALDLSVQAQILNLLRKLQSESDMSYLFIAHDLAVVRHVSQRIVVLYRGRVMEQGDARTVYERAAHPYTRTLLQAAPVPDPEAQRARRLARPAGRSDVQGTMPPDSCPFAPRCPHAVDICRSQRPLLEKTPEHSLVACHRWRELRHDGGGAVVPESLSTAGPAGPSISSPES